MNEFVFAPLIETYREGAVCLLVQFSFKCAAEKGQVAARQTSLSMIFDIKVGFDIDAYCHPGQL